VPTTHTKPIAGLCWSLFAGVLLAAALPGDALAQVSNTAYIATPPGVTDTDPDNNTSTVVTPLAGAVATTKSASPATGTTVAVGQTITYTLTTVVSDGPLTTALQLSDTLGAGLAFGAVTSAGSFSCGTGNPVICTLPAGTVPGSYSVSYTATVTSAATTSVGNTVAADQGTCTDCSTSHPLLAISTTKSVDVGDGTPVQRGQTLVYTVTTQISGAGTTGSPLVLVDTLGAGLTFAAITSPGAFTCVGGNPVRCTLPSGTAPGSYPVSYSATVDDTATTSVGNSVVPDHGTCTDCTTTNPLVGIVTGKSASPATGTQVAAGDTITYSLTTTITGGDLTQPLTLTDTLGSGLVFGAVTSAGSFSCNATNPVTCTLPAGTAAGTYTVQYTATVDAAATIAVRNSVVPSDGECDDCETLHPLVAVLTRKSSDVGNGSGVQAGQTLNYTLTTVINGGPLATALVLTDTLGPGLAFGAVTSAGSFSCNAANPVVCTLPAGTAAGTYAVTYSAVVQAAATVQVNNTVVPNQGGCVDCSTTNPLISITTTKTSDVGDGTAVERDQLIAYTVTVSISGGGALGSAFTITDTLGAGLSLHTITNAGAYHCSAANPIVCTLPSGTPAGTYAVTYTALVEADAVTSVSNSVVPSDGECSTCRTENPLNDPALTYEKSVQLPAGRDAAMVGDTLVYTLTVTVATASTTTATILTDTAGTGLLLVEVTSPGPFACSSNAPLVCTLPAGTAPGTYALSYTATVTASARGSVSNTVVGTGDDGPSCGGTCTTDTPVLTPAVDVSKSADPSSGSRLQRGQTVTYTLTAVIANAPLTAPLVLTDTPDPGLTIGALPRECAIAGPTVVCTLPTGTAVGTHTIRYPATVNPQAASVVNNAVSATGGGPQVPGCDNCTTQHQIDEPLLRIVKTAGAREVKVGDLVLYTLRIENVGGVDLVGGSIVDTTPAGFSFVAGSLQQDGASPLTVSGAGPIRLGSLDLAVGGKITVSYLMRVGAGVRQGTHINQAQVQSSYGDPISNVATAQVVLTSDPLTDESLIHGTVFDDRDGDGWQDRADLGDVRVRGGFAEDDYVPGSTTVDRGNGQQPLSDASAPMLHGIALGALSARQSDADPAERHRIVVRQRLRQARFNDDFVLTSREGYTLRMDADGNTTIERSGDAAKGLNAAVPSVRRVVSEGADGTVVEYDIRNAGVDERGIPGVRVASVEGLLMETDQFGRYHLVGIDGGGWEHGRNFVLKVDPATLPPGARFTTDNPLLRRITPGVPVRFDWGVQLPPGTIPGGTEHVEVVLGKVLFAPGSASIADRHLPAIDRMAEQMRGRRGEVVVSATGEPPALAFARAGALKQALEQRLTPQDRAGLEISVRDGDDGQAPLIAGWSDGGNVLGTLLFDSGRATIRPEYGELLDRMAEALERGGGGRVAIVGHTDVHGSHTYNTQLGLRRAKAVFDALVQRLSPPVRAKVQVEASADPRKPVGTPPAEAGQ
jgi:uncharacterized repeat protein (TIGR01451 family)/fimbrial isopeptide formation D2 family protein